VIVLLDADALIKLYKAGVLELSSQAFECVTSSEIYRGAVLVGGEQGYPDAREIGRIIEAGIEVKLGPSGRETMPELEAGGTTIHPTPPTLDITGLGEKSLLPLVRLEEESIIVSDDRQFLAFLTEQDISFVPVAGFIVVLVREGALDVNTAREALDRITPIIRDTDYQKAIQDLNVLTY
jgi:hypothetical protein